MHIHVSLYLFCYELQFFNSNSPYTGSLLYGCSSLGIAGTVNCIWTASPEASAVLQQLERSRCYTGLSLTQSRSYQEEGAVLFYPRMFLTRIREYGAEVLAQALCCLRVMKHIHHQMRGRASRAHAVNTVWGLSSSAAFSTALLEVSAERLPLPLPGVWRLTYRREK